VTWKIEAVKADEHTTTHDLLISFLVARQYWKKLSKPAREAVLAAYPDHCLTAHRNTLAALRSHGFTECPFPAACKVPCWRPVLTEAGKAIAKWNRS
jgi:hypothetical protein